MFMMSFRLRKSGMIALGLVLAAALLFGIQGIGNVWPSGGSVAADTRAPSDPEQRKKLPAKTNGDRLNFIASYGWEADEEPAEIMEVIIPKEFDEVYMQYNGIQLAQGYDLEKYAGKRCKRFSYNVKNYPGTDSPVRCNLLVYKDKVIGGDVCSLDAEGFIHGFEAEAR